MNIQFNPQSKSNTNFTGAFNVNKLKQVMPEVRVGKNFTYLDKVVFHSYVNSKPFVMGLSHEEISELNKYSGKDFVYKSYDFLTKKLGFGENIRPSLFIQDAPCGAAATYMNLTNIILVDPNKIKNMNNTEIFGLIRHELQHFIQNIRILRHEKIGLKVIDTTVSKYYELQRRNLMQICSSSDQDIIKAGYSQQLCPPHEFIGTVMYAKRCLATNNMSALDQMCQDATEIYRRDLVGFRDEIIKNMGVIKNDSSLTPRIESDFKEFNEMGYYNPDGTINSKMYVNSNIEKEAYSAQGASSSEFSEEPCFMKYLKKQVEKDLKDQSTIDFLDDVCS